MRPNCLMASGSYCRGGSEGLFHAWLGNISAQWQPFTHPVTHTLADPCCGPVLEESYKRRRFLLLVSCRPSHVLDSPAGDLIWWATELRPVRQRHGRVQRGVSTTTTARQNFIGMSQNLQIASSYVSRPTQTASIWPHPLQPILIHQPQRPSTVPFTVHPLDNHLCLLSFVLRLRINQIIIFWHLHQAFNQNGPVGHAWRRFFFPN